MLVELNGVAVQTIASILGVGLCITSTTMVVYEVLAKHMSHPKKNNTGAISSTVLLTPSS